MLLLTDQLSLSYLCFESLPYDTTSSLPLQHLDPGLDFNWDLSSNALKKVTFHVFAYGLSISMSTWTSMSSLSNFF